MKHSLPVSGKTKTIYYIGLIMAVWFAWTGMLWTYNAALLIAYPVGITSFILWYMIRDKIGRKKMVIPVILVIGLILSLVVLVYLLIWD